MTTRIKIAVGVGLLAIAVGAVIVRSFRPKSAVTVSFVRYTEDGAAVLNLTNSGRTARLCSTVSVTLYSKEDRRKTSRLRIYYVLAAGSDTQLVAGEMLERFEEDPPPRRPVLPSTILVASHAPHTSQVRRHINAFLIRLGIDSGNTSWTSVDLPPRPAAPSLGPTNQNTP